MKKNLTTFYFKIFLHQLKAAGIGNDALKKVHGSVSILKFVSGKNPSFEKLIRIYFMFVRNIYFHYFISITMLVVFHVYYVSYVSLIFKKVFFLIN